LDKTIIKTFKEKLHVHCTLSVLKETTLNVLKLPYANEAIFTQYGLSSHK